MANYYSIATAQVRVPCSAADFQELEHLIKEEVLDEGGEPAFHGYTVEYCHGEVYLSTGGEDSAQEVYLPKRFLARMGQVLKNAEIPFLEVGVAFLCDKLRPDSHGGTRFRIYQDGTLKYAATFFIEDLTRKEALKLTAELEAKLSEESPRPSLADLNTDSDAARGTAA